MKYHSRSPEELRRHLEESGKSKRKIRVGTIILLVDIAVIVLIAIFLFNKGGNNMDSSTRNEKIVRATSDKKSFLWKEYQITSTVDSAQKIIRLHIAWKDPQIQKTEKPVTQYQWLVMDKTGSANEESIYSGERNKILPGQETSMDLPSGFAQYSTYIIFFNSANEELFRFRAYP